MVRLWARERTISRIWCFTAGGGVTGSIVSAVISSSRASSSTVSVSIIAILRGGTAFVHQPFRRKALHERVRVSSNTYGPARRSPFLRRTPAPPVPAESAPHGYLRAPRPFALL